MLLPQWTRTYILIAWILLSPFSSATHASSNLEGCNHDPLSVNYQLPRATVEMTQITPGVSRMIAARRTFIAQYITNASYIQEWLGSLGSSGQWPDVNYATGCDAQRANWPAAAHWQRIATMSAVYSASVDGATQYREDQGLLAAINKAMNYWFDHDFTNPSCLDSGGSPRCSCGTPGLWNTNWFSSVLLIPKLVARSCLMLNTSLTIPQHDSCNRQTLRAYGTFDHVVNGAGGPFTGANLLDLAAIGVDIGLLNVNLTMLSDAYRRVHAEVMIKKQVAADGIHPDGSFGQHKGLLYNGNYGKDYLNDILSLEIIAAGTEYEAGPATKSAFATLIDADLWMIYLNVVTDILHWDISSYSRFICFSSLDRDQTSSQLKVNIEQVKTLGLLWKSTTVTNAADILNKTYANANSGYIHGNRVFFSNDYMVHRGSGYVTTLKMFSTRTRNSECINTANPYGFHLSDGALRTYLKGNEYEDLAPVMDWNLIPGITVDYNGTALSCDKTTFLGTRLLVGGVSTGTIGLAAMRYINPYTGKFGFQKAWFFLDNDVQYVLTSNVTSSSSSPTYSVLDQRLSDGEVVVNGTESAMSSLWHGGIGYAFDDPYNVIVKTETKSGGWSAIGTTVALPVTKNLFTAYIIQRKPQIAYKIFPATSSASSFNSKIGITKIVKLQNDAHISAVYDSVQQTLMATFWDKLGGTIVVPNLGSNLTPFSLTASNASTIIYQAASDALTVSDPTQILTKLTVTFRRKACTKVRVFDLPQEGLAGKSTSSPSRTSTTSC